jgi:hypothetical protein
VRAFWVIRMGTFLCKERIISKLAPRPRSD